MSETARWPRLTGFAVGLGCGLLAKDLGLRAAVSYWGPVTPGVVALGVLGAALWTTRVRSAFLALAGCLVVLWLVVGMTPLEKQLVRPLIRQDQVVTADAIFVLSSNVQPDGEPSAVALSRASRGLELLGEGRAPRILLSELRPPAGSYVRWLRESAHRMGLPTADAVESVGLVDNTHDEAVRVAAMFRERGWRRLLLVTSPVHSRRAAAVFEKAGVPEVVSVPSMETEVDIQRMRRSDERIFAFGPTIHEWIGLLVYRWRGWI